MSSSDLSPSVSDVVVPIAPVHGPDTPLASAVMDAIAEAHGSVMIEALRLDTTIASRLQQVLDATVDDSCWKAIAQDAKTQQGRGELTSILLLIETLPEGTPVRSQLNATLARIRALTATAQSNTSVRAAWVDPGASFDQLDRKNIAFLKGVANSGIGAVENMATNVQARDWLMQILGLQFWSAEQALEQLRLRLSAIHSS